MHVFPAGAPAHAVPPTGTVVHFIALAAVGSGYPAKSPPSPGGIAMTGPPDEPPPAASPLAGPPSLGPPPGADGPDEDPEPDDPVPVPDPEPDDGPEPDDDEDEPIGAPEPDWPPLLVAPDPLPDSTTPPEPPVVAPPDDEPAPGGVSVCDPPEQAT
jgi:hypothetical protein